jgi:serine/threonine protein kinase
MGEVFLAKRREEQGGTPLVLKRLRPELAQTEEYRKRLVFEAQVASRLVHPNLVRMLEFGRVGDCDYLVMEHVAGFSLKRLLDRAIELDRPVPPNVAVTIGLGILRALAVMHDTRDEANKPRPILHRDVTPGNVIITHYGRPVMIDFGIAKDVLGPAITQVGKVIGTVRYMSPEHKKAEFLEPSADVFSASVILWELLTARPPWPPMPGARELLRTVFDPPEIDQTIRQRIPEDLMPVLLQGLECDANRRYQTAQAMVSALESTSTVNRVEGTSRSDEVKGWITTMEIPADEELDGMVIDTQSSAGDVESRYWDHKGRVRAEEPPRIPTDTIPPSEPISIPPLPPRRHSVLETGDLAMPSSPTKDNLPRGLLIGSLVILGVVLGWAIKTLFL